MGPEEEARRMEEHLSEAAADDPVAIDNPANADEEPDGPAFT